ncbi:hypothetical protein EVAR_83064_1 [Eumeta japonica]|uniref:Uncharacterized protein n=1 Tax=Eumeta variegata TaxID=151549 RepID=A0A4C1VNJ0_EUMVA|nr:hypothetical protein EVAR_83064_1 [Eumeta japonica]
MTERHKCRYTKGSVIRGVRVLARIRSDGSVEPAGIPATLSQKLDSGTRNGIKIIAKTETEIRNNIGISVDSIIRCPRWQSHGRKLVN